MYQSIQFSFSFLAVKSLISTSILSFSIFLIIKAHQNAPWIFYLFIVSDIWGGYGGNNLYSFKLFKSNENKAAYTLWLVSNIDSSGITIKFGVRCSITQNNEWFFFRFWNLWSNSFHEKTASIPVPNMIMKLKLKLRLGINIFCLQTHAKKGSLSTQNRSMFFSPTSDDVDIEHIIYLNKMASYMDKNSAYNQWTSKSAWQDI